MPFKSNYESYSMLEPLCKRPAPFGAKMAIALLFSWWRSGVLIHFLMNNMQSLAYRAFAMWFFLQFTKGWKCLFIALSLCNAVRSVPLSTRQRRGGKRAFMISAREIFIQAEHWHNLFMANFLSLCSWTTLAYYHYHPSFSLLLYDVLFFCIRNQDVESSLGIITMWKGTH